MVAVLEGPFVGLYQASPNLLYYCEESNLKSFELVLEWHELVCLCIPKVPSTNFLLRTVHHLKLKVLFKLILSRSKEDLFI